MQVLDTTESLIQVFHHQRSSFSSESLGIHASMQSIHYCLNTYYFLSSQGRLLKINPKTTGLVQVDLPVKIKKILQVCNSDRTLVLLCDIGVYYLGQDVLSNGLTYAVEAVEGLEQVRFVHASINTTHAAGIDDLGNLYMWGGSHGRPHLVEAAKVFTSAKVVSTEELTCVCTGGGYVYLFGDLGRETSGSLTDSIERGRRENKRERERDRDRDRERERERENEKEKENENEEELPYTLPEIEKFFIVDICIGKGFCGVLSEEGVVLCFDRTKDLVRMPEVKSVQSIYSFEYGIIGISPGFLYKWYGNIVREWQLEIFKTDAKISVLGSLKSGIAVQGDCCIDYMRKVEAYKMSHETQSLMASLGESREAPLSFLSSPRALTSTNKGKLYSNFFPADDTFNKLLSYRKQHKQAETVVAVIRPIVAPRLEFAWIAISSFVESKKIMNRTVIYTLLPIATEKIFQKIRYINMSFAWERIGMVFRMKIQKEVEVYKIIREKMKNRIERFGALVKKLMIKSKIRFGQYLIDEINKVIEIEKLKQKKIVKLFYLSSKVNRYYLCDYYERWLREYYIMCDFKNGLTKICQVAFSRLGSYALKSVKFHQLVRSTDQSKQKAALKVLSKRFYIKSILHYFTKWGQVRYISKAKKNISKRLYISLAKNIFSVISHKMKKNLKWSFNRIWSSYLNCKLIKIYKHPLLYFATVTSKILCRLKFSTFTAIQRAKSKCNTTISSYISETHSSLYFTLEAIYLSRMRYFMNLMKNEIKITSVSLTNIASDYPEQTVTFARYMENVTESSAGMQEMIPKLALKGLQNSKKPPISTRPNIKYILKTPVKAPSRSGSFSGTPTRDDSLTRRINYDNQLRKKQKNNEKFLKKSDTYKECISLIKGKPKRRKILEVKPNYDPEKISNNENLLKQSLGIFSLKKLFDKKVFKLTLKSFKIMKKCYKYTKIPHPRCIKHSPEKLCMKDYHFS